MSLQRAMSKICMQVFALLMVYSVQPCGSDRDATEPGCSVGDACATPGSSILQARALRQHSEVVLDDSSQETDTADVGSAATWKGMETEVVEHHGYKINMQTNRTGVRKWLIDQPQCTTAVLDQFAKNLTSNVTLVREFDPDASGFCFLVVEATLDALKRELVSRHWPLGTTVEEDFPWWVPELEEPGVGKPSLLEEANTNLPWGLDRIDARSGMDGYFTPVGSGTGVHVFVADTGIRVTHTQFEGRAKRGVETLKGVVDCSNLSDNSSCAEDRHGHGTHCAGTIGGRDFGVAKAVTLWAVKVLGDDGGGSTTSIISGLEWVVAHCATPKVFSATFGGDKSSSTPLKDAIDIALNRGVVVVVSAGNSGFIGADPCDYSPAHLPSAITVGATTSSDAKSDLGGTCVDIFAPGAGILSASTKSDTATAMRSSTSVACAHVSGAAALLLQRFPTLTNRDVTDALLASATKGALIGNLGSGSPNLLLYTDPVLPPPPANCSFELRLCGGWYESMSDTFNWRRHHGPTNSGETGPNSAVHGTWYMYTEGSTPRKMGDTAILESDRFGFPEDMTMTFYYHMYGAHMGTLKVEVDGAEVMSVSGNQGTHWIPASINFYKGERHKISFSGTTRDPYAGDLAIDDIRFVPGVLTKIVEIGPSRVNPGCINVEGPPLYCDDNAGDKGIRANLDFANATDDFTISQPPGRICAHRMDSEGGWGMRLMIRCGLGLGTAAGTTTTK